MTYAHDVDMQMRIQVLCRDMELTLDMFRRNDMTEGTLLKFEQAFEKHIQKAREIEEWLIQAQKK